MMISTSQPTYRTSSYCLTEESVTQLLSEIEGRITRIARNLFYTGYAKSIPVDDLKQEGMIAAWQATYNYDPSKIKDEGSFKGYCISIARYAMLNYIKQSHKLPSTSLEEYLTVETDHGTEQLDIADTYRPVFTPNKRKRRFVLKAMDRLTQKERSILMAEYRIDNRRGPCATIEEVKQRLKLSQSAYYGLKYRAMRKIIKISTIV